MFGRILYFLSALILVVSLPSAGQRAVAESVVGPWVKHGPAVQTRIVRTPHPEIEGKDIFAWEAEFQYGWKAYWRSPGEAGLPVRLFDGDREIEIYYPFPERFELFGMETYGYGGHVMLPFSLDKVPEQVKVDFMICKDVCIPYSASYEMAAVGQTDPLAAIRLTPWYEGVPDREGDGGGGLDVLSAQVTGPAGRQRLIVDLAAGSQLTRADVLAEAGAPFQFARPRVKLLEDGRRVRAVLTVMTGKLKESLRGKEVRITFSDGRGHAIDRTLRIPN